MIDCAPPDRHAGPPLAINRGQWAESDFETGHKFSPLKIKRFAVGVDIPICGRL
jgi:hypothetical protein